MLSLDNLGQQYMNHPLKMSEITKKYALKRIFYYLKLILTQHKRSYLEIKSSLKYSLLDLLSVSSVHEEYLFWLNDQ